MKVNFKRVATAALAVAMSLSLSVPAFAEGNGGNKKLTVTGATLDNKKVYAVQMFDARVTEGANNTFDNYEMVNSEKWMEFFTASEGDGGVGLTDQDKDLDTDADDARAYLEKLASESAAVKAFADKAQAWVRNHSANFTVITSDTEDPAVADKETFSDLKPGYYLVYPEGGSTGTENRGTDAMLVNVPTNGNAEWAMKSTFPTVDKTVEDNNNNTNGDGANGSAQVGDTVTFTLKSTVPDMSDYSTFYFAFNDTMSNGLQFVQKQPDPAIVDANDVTVTIGGKTVTGGYTVKLDGNVLKVEFTNLKTATVQDGTIATGDPIVVTYQAMITEAAVVGNPALNTVKVEYSNDPTTGTKGESTPDISKVYTYDINVNKWALSGKQDDPETEEEDESKIENLADAQFQLTTDEAGEEVVKLVANGTNAYRVAKPDATRPDGYEAGAVDSFTTTNNGDIKISGLEAGTYYLHEIEAPDGYNKLKKPVKIEIIVSEGNYENATIKVNNEAVTGGNVIDVENKKGIELPETGSIGTIGLTALGVVVVVAGLFAFPRKKKTRQD